MNLYPDKDKIFPVNHPYFQTMCFLKNIIKNPNIIVGDYTYYHDFENINNFENWYDLPIAQMKNIENLQIYNQVSLQKIEQEQMDKLE